MKGVIRRLVSGTIQVFTWTVLFRQDTGCSHQTQNLPNKKQEF